MWCNLLLVFLFPLLPAFSFGIKEVTFLRPNEPHVQDVQTMLQMLYVHNKVHVFCKEATPPSLWNVFQSSRLRLQIPAAEDYKQYKAESIKAVHQAHYGVMEDFEGKPMGLGTNKHRIISLSAHNDACYGIYTNSEFALTLEVNSCDIERVAQFIFGFVLWICCPLLTNSLLWVYCTAAALGAHLAGVVVVFGAVLASGEERSFARLCPLKANFKQVYEERPTLVSLMLLVGAWIVYGGSKKGRLLWRYRIIRTLHCRLLRGVAYYLILNASDYRDFGRSCVVVLLVWPEVWQLMNFLRSQYMQYSNQRCLLGVKEVKRDMCTNRSRQVDPPRHFPRYRSEDNPGILRNATQQPFATYENSDRHMRRHQEPLDRQGREDKDEAWNTIFYPNARSPPFSEYRLRSC
ncbi:uncharacterized protein [Drosophila kikkawai]|uniref:Uncharacterized protein n=1 Tax=Drosophila kikkawai TaxID=30033 RepID=A0A6P4IWD4_DROKI|nr:uncharacterized protein LOC108082096 [Drosophila kikkawai]